MCNKVLFLDNNIIYPIYSYEVDNYNQIYDKHIMLYFNHKLKIEIDSNKVDKEFLKNLNKTNYDDTKIVLFNENNLKCVIFSKAYLKPFIKSDFNITLIFEAVSVELTSVLKVDSLKYIARNLKIKRILEN